MPTSFWNVIIFYLSPLDSNGSSDYQTFLVMANKKYQIWGTFPSEGCMSSKWGGGARVIRVWGCPASTLSYLSGIIDFMWWWSILAVAIIRSVQTSSVLPCHHLHGSDMSPGTCRTRSLCQGPWIDRGTTASCHMHLLLSAAYRVLTEWGKPELVTEEVSPPCKPKPVVVIASQHEPTAPCRSRGCHLNMMWKISDISWEFLECDYIFTWTNCQI